MEPAAIAGLVVIGLAFLVILAFLVRLGWMIVTSVSGLAQATSGGPGPVLRAWGWTVTSDLAGGAAQGTWNTVPVEVRWSMQVSPDVGGVRGAPRFATEMRVTDGGADAGSAVVLPEVLSDADRLRAALDDLIEQHLGEAPA